MTSKLKRKCNYYEEHFKDAKENYMELIKTIRNILDKPDSKYPEYYPKDCAPPKTGLFANREAEIRSLLEEAVGWISRIDIYAIERFEETFAEIMHPLKLNNL